MKHRIIFSVALILSIVLVSLMHSDSPVEAQNGGRSFNYDTGVVTLGPNQILRVTVAGGDVNGDGSFRVRFRQMNYIEQGNIYRLVNQTTTAPVQIAPGEAATITGNNTYTGPTAVRLLVQGNFIGTDATGTAVVQIINTETGQVDSVLVALLLP